MSTTTAHPDKSVEGGRRPGLALAVVLLAVLVVPMSISGTAVALPGIGADLHASGAALQWVVNAFNVAFACCTLVWGSVADIVGRVRVFAAGAALFAAAATASALAGNAYVLDAARALAGIGGAAIFSAGAAILSTAYEGHARARAFALFGTVAGVGVSLGPTFAGQLVASVGWRWVFALHAAALVLALLALPTAARALPATARGAARIDVPGSLVLVAAAVLLTTGIVQGSQWGWGSVGVLALFAGAVAALVGFVRVERRSPHPVLDLGLLRRRRFVGLALVPVAASAGFVTLLTYLPSYLTAVTGRDSSAAGRLMLLLTLPVLVAPVAAARLVRRGVSARALILASLGCLVAGDLGLLLFSPHAAVAVVALPMLVTGAGMGLSAGLVDGQALALVPPGQAGMAAGFVNTLRLGSEAVAVAVYGSVMASLVGAGHAYDTAFHGLLQGLAGVCLVLGATVAWLLRPEADDARTQGM
ncbi:MFS transporter [Streptomyces longispororuber]|uniref:MFS transporter n=1 Tax=Streptomyces longispororuber TaxID=68230 RepID=UPI00210B8A80|nr:MFS transporter [Streptomyces longispororuber]MCQ4209337.1 MFS transporter [Streptomyces longispororuber]